MTVFLIRHAQAGTRARWTADDRLRPLTKAGRRQAADLVEVFADVPITKVLSSPYRRCVETVAPLAASLGLTTVVEDNLAEGPGIGALALLRSLSLHDAALCSHGDVIPFLLDQLQREDGLQLPPDGRCQKGSVWILEPHPDNTGRFERATYVPPPD